MIYDKSLLENNNHGDACKFDMHGSKEITGGDLCRINHRFMGAGMSQNYVGIYFFEYYQQTHKFEYVVEFGSQKGALSTYFANAAAISEQFFFETYEWDRDKDWYSRENEGAGHWFDKLAKISPYVNGFSQDVFSEDTLDHVRKNSEQFKTFIFCDGGDKVKEFNMYAPLKKPGDRIAVHDWGTEIDYPAIQETCEKYSLVPDEPWTQSNTNFGTLIMPFRVKDV